MQIHEAASAPAPIRTPWNKGKLIGAKPPLWPKHVWSIRAKLQMEGRILELALFNLAIDSKLRGATPSPLRSKTLLPMGMQSSVRQCVRKRQDVPSGLNWRATPAKPLMPT